jgi:hypothetical protein
MHFNYFVGLYGHTNMHTHTCMHTHTHYMFLMYIYYIIANDFHIEQFPYCTGIIWWWCSTERSWSHTPNSLTYLDNCQRYLIWQWHWMTMNLVPISTQLWSLMEWTALALYFDGNHRNFNSTGLLSYWRDVLSICRPSVIHPHPELGNRLMNFSIIWQEGSWGQYPEMYFRFFSLNNFWWMV